MIAMPIVSAKEMAQIDAYAIRTLQIPDYRLMNLASQLMWKAFKEWAHGNFQDRNFALNSSSRLLFACGAGNNGGDGLRMASLASKEGYAVTVLLLKEKGSPLFEMQLERVRDLGLPVFVLEHFSEDEVSTFLLGFDFYFDAFLGTGCSRPLEGNLLKIKTIWNSLSSGSRIAVDIPSGCREIEGERGAFQQDFLHADLTLTVELPKKSFYQRENRSYCGEIRCCTGVFPQEAIEAVLNSVSKEKSFLISSWQSVPSPNPATVYKNSRGRVSAIVGSMRYPGAAFLIGDLLSRLAGFVRTVLPNSLKQSLLQRSPSVVVEKLGSNPFCTLTKEIALLNAKTDVWLVGCGWSGNLKEYRYFKSLLAELKSKGGEKPIVIDATALTLLSKHPSLIRYRSENWILTPHWGEYQILCQTFLKKKAANECDLLSLSNQLGCVIVLKGAVNRMAYRNQLYLYDSCRAHLATAGSGDLLAAIIAVMRTIKENNKCSVLEAISNAILLHAEASDETYRENGWFAANQIIPYVAKRFAQYRPSIQINHQSFPLKTENKTEDFYAREF